MQKFCNKCKVLKDEGEFGRRTKNKDGLQSNCKSCQSLYHKNRYLELSYDGKKKKVQLSLDRRRSIRDLVVSLALQSGCIDCGYNKNPAPLQFDHRGDKKHNVSDMIRFGYSLSSIMDEIGKCDVRCANCHAIKTAVEQNWYS